MKRRRRMTGRINKKYKTKTKQKSKKTRTYYTVSRGGIRI